MASYFGLGKELITPPFKTSVACMGRRFGEMFESIHDDVFARALVIDDGREKLVLMSFDLLFHSNDIKDLLSAYAMSRYGVKPEALVVNYSHNHMAPSSRGYDNANTSEEYEEFLLERGRACIDRAFANMFEGKIAYGTSIGDWNVSRRKMVDGVMTFLPNFDGPKDDKLAVIAIWDTGDRLRGLWLNYACHPVFLVHSDVLDISAEYPGRLCQIMEYRHYGCMVGFTQGAGGHSRPKSTVKAGGFQPCTYGELDAMSYAMAEAVDSLLMSKNLKQFVPGISARAFTINLPVDAKPVEYFEDAAFSQQIETYRFNARKVAAGYDDTIPGYVPARCGLIKLTDGICIAHVCGEPCYEVKQLIEKVLQDQEVLFLGYTDATAYIVTDKLLAEGGYESSCFLEYCLKGPFKPGIDSVFENAFKQAFEDICQSRG